MFKLLFFLNIKSYLKNAKTKLNINYNCNQKNLLNVDSIVAIVHR